MRILIYLQQHLTDGVMVEPCWSRHLPPLYKRLSEATCLRTRNECSISYLCPDCHVVLHFDPSRDQEQQLLLLLLLQQVGTRWTRRTSRSRKRLVSKVLAAAREIIPRDLEQTIRQIQARRASRRRMEESKPGGRRCPPIVRRSKARREYHKIQT